MGRKEGVHAMSRNSGENRSSNEQREMALMKHAKAVLRVTAAATRLVAI
jgi:hypothetical protein